VIDEMRVALINPPSKKGLIRSGRWVRKTRAAQQWYPIWLGYATALLEREGHKCLLLDASVEGLSVDDAVHRTSLFKPDYIAIYWSYDTYQQDLQFAELCASLGEVVLVGPWSFCIPNLLEISRNVHFMTFGEFEHTLLEVVEGDKTWANIKGLTWRFDNHTVIRNEPRPLCSSEELDRIPFVSDVYKRFLDFKKYRQTSLRFPFTNLQTSRGCPHRCVYCVQTRAMQGGSSYRARSIKNVVEELWWIKHNLPQIKQVFFQDETITQKRAIELSQAILDEKLDICWAGLARGELDYEVLRLMDLSGCRTLQVGFETPIQKYLDVIHKDITVGQYERFCKDIKRTRIWINAAFMVFPWMNKADIDYTVDWAKRMHIQRLSFITALSYPNTPYAELVSGCKGLSWSESVELEKYGHRKYYLQNPRMWKQILSNPHKWRDVVVEAGGLLKSLVET